MSTPPDEHFKSGRLAMPDETVAVCGYLRPLSPREELAGFLTQRGERWGDFGDFQQKTLCYAYAYEIAPAFGHCQVMIDQSLRQWREQVQKRLPPKPAFPQLDLGLPAQRFSRLPQPVEREIIALRVTEGLLNDRELDRKWWEPARRGHTVKDLPATLRVDYRWN